MYEFYKSQYHGDAISQEAFPELMARAADQLAHYERCYRVTGSEQQRSMALCAMAEALEYFRAAQNGQGGLRYASVGTVSVSGKGIYTQVDISPRALEQELLRCVRRYMTVYRGAGGQ